MPANRLPSVCCAARPRITAVKAPPTSSVRASTPATLSATSSVIASVARRIRNPTGPAVAGSRRRNSAGPSARPKSRAIAQPRTSSTITVTMRTAVFAPGELPCASTPSRLARLS